MKMNRHKIMKSIGVMLLVAALAAAYSGYVPDQTLAAGGNVKVTLSNAEGLDPNTEFDFEVFKVGHFSGPGLVLEDNLAASGADVSFPSDSTETEAEKSARMLSSAYNLAKFIDEQQIHLDPIGGVHKLKPGNSFQQAVGENGLYLVRANTVRDSSEGAKFNWTPQPVYVAVLNGEGSITLLNNEVVTKIVRTPVALNHRVQKTWTIPEGAEVTKPEAIFVNIRYSGKIVDTVKLVGGDSAWAYLWTSEEDGTQYKYIGKDDSGNPKTVTFTPDTTNPKWTVDEILDADAYAADFDTKAYEGVTPRTFTDAEKEDIAKLALRFVPKYTEPDSFDSAATPDQQSEQLSIHDIDNVFTKTELQLTKKLDGYVDAGEKSNVTMAFKVIAKDNKGNQIYENTVGITFSKNDEVDADGKYTKTATVKDIPPNAASVEVTEVYSAGYAGPTDPVKAQFVDGIWVAQVDNTHGPGQGSGVVNKYENGEIAGQQGLSGDEAR